VAATIILVLALGALSEIVLPLTLAAVLAVIFKPAVGWAN
jgi:predicted PurR-regulated permease PerM